MYVRACIRAIDKMCIPDDMITEIYFITKLSQNCKQKKEKEKMLLRPFSDFRILLIIFRASKRLD